jgi:hypothetical protein
MTKSLNIEKMDKREGLITGRLADWGFRENLTVSIRPESSTEEAYRLEVVSTRSRSLVMRDWGEDMIQDVKSMIEKLPNHKGGVRLVSEPLSPVPGHP